jgi:hypothetical protein
MTRYIFATALFLMCADASSTSAQACGGSTSDIGDNFSMWDTNNGWGCQQQFIDYWWNAYDFDEGDWDNGMGYSDPCNNNLPLARTFNGMWHLGYVGTNTPNCDTTALNKTLWAQCWTAAATDEVDSDCYTGATATAKSCQDCDWEDCRTILHKPFFYSQNPARRAATLFHEARHTRNGGCGHNGESCARGSSCEESYTNGCEESWAGGLQKGANSYEVIYIESYVFFGWRTTTPMKNNMVSAGNDLFSRAYDTVPCKSMLSNGLITSC